MDESDTMQSVLRSYQNTLDSLHKCYGTVISAQKLTMSPVIRATQHLQEVFSAQLNLEFGSQILSSVERIQRYREPYTSILQQSLDQYRIFMDDFSSSLKGVTDETLNAGVIQSFLENCSTHISSDALKSALASAKVTDSYVEVPDKAMETLNKTFKCPETSSVCSNSSGNKIHRIGIRDFIITVIFPILCMIVPMLQNSYYHRLDVLEEKKSQFQEEQFQEQLLQLVEDHNQQIEKLNSTITELLDYIQSLPEYPSVNRATSEVLSPDHESPECPAADCLSPHHHLVHPIFMPDSQHLIDAQDCYRYPYCDERSFFLFHFPHLLILLPPLIPLMVSCHFLFSLLYFSYRLPPELSI